jgi:hypothetical protein
MNEEESRVTKALKKTEGAPVLVVCRGGKPCKIIAQTVRLPERDGVIVTFEFPADIID